eukprot:COSAG01_NODE_1431_length_10324_cov_23.953154_3_plen_143_part_00
MRALGRSLYILDADGSLTLRSEVEDRRATSEERRRIAKMKAKKKKAGLDAAQDLESLTRMSLNFVRQVKEPLTRVREANAETAAAAADAAADEAAKADVGSVTELGMKLSGAKAGWVSACGPCSFAWVSALTMFWLAGARAE